MIENINPTDRLVFDLNMYQVDYNEQKIKKIDENFDFVVAD